MTRSQVLVNDEDLLSASTQHAVSDMAFILGVILIVAMFLANLVAPQQRSRVMADFVVGLFARATTRGGHPITDGPPVSRTIVTANQCAPWVADDDEAT